MDIWSILEQEWAFRALIASILVGLSCGVLGCFIVLRNMALIGDALSHAILPGVFLAFLIAGYNVFGFFIGSVMAGMVAAVGITWLQQKVKTKNDAAIGIVFTAMFSLGVMGISWISKSEGVHLDLKDFLFGNILGISDADLHMAFATTVVVTGSITIFYRQLFVSTFQPTIARTMGISVDAIHYYLMLLLSFVVVASLHTVGVILVVAMLITPAATALLMADRLHKVLVWAACAGIFSAVAGLYLAIVFNTNPGPAMAVVATLGYLLAALFSPRKGLVVRFLQTQKQRSRIDREDVLKQSLMLQQANNLSQQTLLEKTGLGPSRQFRLITRLRKEGLFELEKYSLSEKGKSEANRLVRAHRLWETYLVHEVGLSDEQIHEEAEKYEHFLTDEMLDEVDEKLGFPSIDPHGSPIPARRGLPTFSLAQLNAGQKASISHNQINELITNQLWQKGILPGTHFRLLSKDTAFLAIQINDSPVSLPMELARQIAIEPA
jgi:ABC-type Mn2+/Zn2+ transport system permease subunit/Mn-dependent DtxR family transcriptional regulator